MSKRLSTFKKHYFLLVLIFMLGVLNFSFASQDDEPEVQYPDHYFSIDFGILLNGLRNQGWGLGVKYEKLFVPHIAYIIGFSHSTMYTGTENIWCTTVGFAMGVNYYPISRNLDKLYLSTSSGFDYIAYFGDIEKTEEGENPSDMPLFIEGDIGWKQRIVKKRVRYGLSIKTSF